MVAMFSGQTPRLIAGGPRCRRHQVLVCRRVGCWRCRCSSHTAGELVLGRGGGSQVVVRAVQGRGRPAVGRQLDAARTAMQQCAAAATRHPVLDTCQVVSSCRRRRRRRRLTAVWTVVLERLRR